MPGIRTRRVALSDGVALRIVEAGDESDQPVLLVHGWGASLYMWRGWLAPLVAAGFRAIAVDLPGHGLSDKPHDHGRYTLDRMTSSLQELIRLERLRAPHVVAQSMGGTIALELASRREPPIGRLALVNPACFGVVQNLSLARHASPAAMEAVLERIVPRWVVARAHRRVYGDPSLITDADIDQYWAPSQFPGYARAMRRLVHEFTWKRPPVQAMTERLRALQGAASPPLVVLGTRDRLVRKARPYVAALKALGAPMEVYESDGGGHAVNEERPSEIVAVVLRHLGGNG
jgi:pyruvate dehydrogenase E2 component (dihydrolipoamide acetyltransferase)